MMSYAAFSAPLLWASDYSVHPATCCAVAETDEWASLDATEGGLRDYT